MKHQWTETVKGFEELPASERVSQGPTFKASLDAVERWTDSSWGFFGLSYESWQQLQSRVSAARSSAMLETGRSTSGASVDQATPTPSWMLPIQFYGDTTQGVLEEGARRAGQVSRIGGNVIDSAEKGTKTLKDAASVFTVLLFAVVALALYRRVS